MKLKSMDQLFLHALRDLYSAENQLLKALPKLAHAADEPALSEAFEAHLEQTRGQVERLEQIFSRLGARAKGKKCKAMEGLIDEAKELLKERADADVLDAALIAAAQKVEHYEIAGYGCARAFARMLGDEEAAQLLQQTLDEEGETDRQLTELAETMVNRRAAAGRNVRSEQPSAGEEESMAAQGDEHSSQREEAVSDDGQHREALVGAGDLH